MSLVLTAPEELRRRRSFRWARREVRLLQANWRVKGMDVLVDLLPGRTRAAIEAKARRLLLGVRRQRELPLEDEMIGVDE